MSIELQRAYIMGYEDGLARRSPDMSQVDGMDKWTCHDTGEDSDYFTCSECGSRLDVTPYFCPNCGREVVE